VPRWRSKGAATWRATLGEAEWTVRSTTVPRESRVRSPAQARPWDGVLDHLVLLSPGHVARRLHRRSGLRPCACADRLDEAHRHASAMAGGAGACGALNMWWDADIDANMARTAMRPIPRGVVLRWSSGDRNSALDRVGGGACDQRSMCWRRALLALTIAIYVPALHHGSSSARRPSILSSAGSRSAAARHRLAAAMDSVSQARSRCSSSPSYGRRRISGRWPCAAAATTSGSGLPMLPNVVGPVKTCPADRGLFPSARSASFGPMADPGRRASSMALVAGRGERGIPLARLALTACRDAEESARRKAAMALFRASQFSTSSSCSAMLAEVHSARRV